MTFRVSRAALASDLAEGRTITEIARAKGVSTDTISRACDAFGLRTKPHRRSDLDILAAVNANNAEARKRVNPGATEEILLRLAR